MPHIVEKANQKEIFYITLHQPDLSTLPGASEYTRDSHTIATMTEGLPNN